MAEGLKRFLVVSTCSTDQTALTPNVYLKLDFPPLLLISLCTSLLNRLNMVTSDMGSDMDGVLGDVMLMGARHNRLRRSRRLAVKPDRHLRLGCC